MQGPPPKPARSFLFLLSSARANGNSERLARHAASALPHPCVWVDLARQPLPAFHDTRPAPPPLPEGDLAHVLAQMRAASDIVVVAPIYWYALPAPAKLLFDHWSGFLDTPDLGFPIWIAQKTLWLITARADPDPSVAAPIEAAVAQTARWLTMAWGGALHGIGDAPGEVATCPAWPLAPRFLLGNPSTP